MSIPGAALPEAFELLGAGEASVEIARQPFDALPNPIRRGLHRAVLGQPGVIVQGTAR